jgi:hypothetical protein
MRLYDIEKGEYSEFGENSQSFRSTKPGKCDLCHTISNKISFTPHNIYGYLHLICPGRSAKPDIHNLLWEKLRHGFGPEHPASVIKELKKEIKTLRSKFKSIAPDVVGIENWNADDIPLWRGTGGT